MERTVIARGELHEIACAVMQDGSSPADEVFHLMSNGAWQEDPDSGEELPDDAQIEDYDFLLAGLEFFADNGVPHSPSVRMNALDDGIWEFKIRRKRFSFYDTDGVGGKYRRMKYRDKEEAEYPEDEDFWHVPSFEELLRIGHCFPKLEEQTTPTQIRRTLQVRWEDLNHDREKAKSG